MNEEEEARPDNEVDVASWFNNWECSPSWNRKTTERVQQEFAKFQRALMDIESEGAKAAQGRRQRLTATTDFKIVFFQLHRVSMTAIKLMASHAAEVDQLLNYALVVIMHARGNPKLFDKNVPPLLRRIGNYLKGGLAVNPWDISRHWPDGPTTTNGTCSACKGDLNCRWLTDPALGKEDADREPWCQPCYEARLLGRKDTGK